MNNLKIYDYTIGTQHYTRTIAIISLPYVAADLLYFALPLQTDYPVHRCDCCVEVHSLGALRVRERQCERV